jgi:hypothetical protein
MILGLPTSVFTGLHVAVSLVAMASGFVVLAGLLQGRIAAGWTAAFLATTVATSASGFLFHSAAIGPPHILGGLSLAILGLALWAVYSGKLTGAWRRVYVICAVVALYLNVFVGVVQAFQKIVLLHSLAPKGSEPPFVATEAFTLIVFVALGVLAVRRLRNPSPLAAS